MILYACADLLWATKIKGTADALGIAARPVRSVEMLIARLADSPVSALMVDLEMGQTAIDLIRHVRAHEAEPSARPRPLPILAFGPHVDVDGLSAAKAAGATEAVARGGLQARLGEVLKGLDRT